MPAQAPPLETAPERNLTAIGPHCSVLRNPAARRPRSGSRLPEARSNPSTNPSPRPASEWSAAEPSRLACPAALSAPAALGTAAAGMAQQPSPTAALLCWVEGTGLPTGRQSGTSRTAAERARRPRGPARGRSATSRVPDRRGAVRRHARQRACSAPGTSPVSPSPGPGRDEGQLACSAPGTSPARPSPSPGRDEGQLACSAPGAFPAGPSRGPGRDEDQLACSGNRNVAASPRKGRGREEGQPECSAQVPVISTVWLISVNPWSAAIFSAQRSTAGPSTSTVRPHTRHTR